MTLFYRLAADAVMLIHLVYFLTVVLGLPAIWVGIIYRHQWARNFWWRCGHLLMIAIVVAADVTTVYTAAVTDSQDSSAARRQLLRRLLRHWKTAVGTGSIFQERLCNCCDGRGRRPAATEEAAWRTPQRR